MGFSAAQTSRALVEGPLTLGRSTGVAQADVATAEQQPTVGRMEITLGESRQVLARLPNGQPAPAGAELGRWSSSDTTTVMVSGDGAVTGVGWGQASVVLERDEAPADTVLVTVMPVGTFRFEGTLARGSQTARTSVSGEIEFAYMAGGTVATIEGCGSQVVTSLEETFTIECGTTYSFALERPRGISGYASQSLGETGGGVRTQMVRRCAEVNFETGACVRYEWQRLGGGSTRTETRAGGPLTVERVPGPP